MPDAFAGLPVADPETIGLSSPALDRFASALGREIAAGRAPGATLAIARQGQIGFARAFGQVRPDGPEMPLDALFRVYSMTKPLVSVAAMTLVEEGRLFLHPRLRGDQGRHSRWRGPEARRAQSADSRPRPPAPHVRALLRLHRRIPRAAGHSSQPLD
jgi:hypothetical protein